MYILIYKVEWLIKSNKQIRVSPTRSAYIDKDVLSNYMIIESDLLVLVVLGIVFCVDELSDGFGLFSLVSIISRPHLYSEILLICKALIYDSYTHNLFRAGESLSDDILNKIFPDFIKEIKGRFLNIIQV